MADITIQVHKVDVYEEVAKTTAYLGAKAKMDDGNAAFDQIFVTDADRAMLDRFYDESVIMLQNLLKRWIVADNSIDTDAIWELHLSDRFPENLTNGINSACFSFAVNSIVSRWCEITASDKVKEYAEKAAALLADIINKLLYKEKPTRNH